MNKKILSAALAASLVFGAVTPANADTTPFAAEAGASNPAPQNEPQDSPGSSNPEDAQTPGNQTGQPAEAAGSSAEDALFGVIGLAAVIGVAVAGVNFAISQGWIPNPMDLIFPPAPAPAPAPALAPAPAPVRAVAPAPAPVQNAPMYRNCTDVWNRLGRPIRSHEAGFQSKLDRDGDGVGCERDPR
ncbi:MAG: excalibur calcium-binding domain-containing protein [Corynebacterium sp.]|uniref:excalibur calcium-binding domain-containing protein n=1 Tax=Corynebacterium sp. TaxID=1720 RepID=UPI0026DEC7FD|nr:excalibur calcium-binding domain-containing protein [Corynebacterium sp.]MDO5670544.1 excalibur calcium-binding domain-containing protein [Corynebacterium sp.]